MDKINTQRMLADMQTMAFEARKKPLENASDDKINIQFSSLLTQAVENVNAVQKQAGSLKKSFEKGEPGIDLAEVMVASQKAGIAFKAAVEVRNKLVKAYQDIINMPV